MDELLTLPETPAKERLPRPARPQLRLFVRLFLLSLPFILFLLFFEVRFAQLEPSDIQAKKHLFERQLSRTQVLILGSSHEFAGILPKELGLPAFDLAGQSQSLYYDTALIYKYLPRLKSLKLVILPVSYFSLQYELDEGPEAWRAYQYDYFYSIPHRNWHKTISARNFSAYFLCSESFRARVTFGLATNATVHFDEWGGLTNRPDGNLLPAKADTNVLCNAAVGTIQRHEAMMKPENMKPILARLDRLIQDLRRRHIHVLLITSPVTRFYGALMQPATYRQMQRAIHQLTQKYHVPYRNYTFDSRFNDSDFADADHLNFRGAHKFSRILKTELLRQLGIKKPSSAPARPE
jgi:hypothetical protein